jgi:hypothetical protein
VDTDGLTMQQQQGLGDLAERNPRPISGRSVVGTDAPAPIHADNDPPPTRTHDMSTTETPMRTGVDTAKRALPACPTSRPAKRRRRLDACLIARTTC